MPRKGPATVRLSEEKIKAAILDSDLNIRQRAIRYFSTSFSTDPSVMPLVIKAIETFGRQNAYHLIGLSRDLPQTEETIAWIIDELNDEQTSQHENYAYNLSMVLVKADPALLLTNASEIMESRHFLPALRPSFSERLQMLSWDEATCWQKLEEFCEQGKDKRYVNEVNLSYGNRIIEALARYGDQCQEKVYALLSQKIEDYRHNPMKWMEPLVVRLAGKAQLASTVPMIIAKLIEDGGDLMNEACAEALVRIGTSAVVEAVARAYSNAPDHFRLYATEPLESIHSDLAVEKCLQLLRKETDADIRLNLAHALLSHFTPEGIEEARKLLVGRKLNFEEKGLREYLLETCTFTGGRFPEYDEWLAIEKAEKAEHRKKVEELQDDPAGLVKFALEKMTGKKTDDILKPKPPLPPTSSLALPHQQASKQKVGRNDLCPCGSGKKFKKCCLTRN
jgi:hypothetical protein